MGNRIFIDLNIVIDVVDSNRQRHESSKAVLRKAIKEDFEMIVSSDMLTNFFYICQKKFDCRNMTKALSFIRSSFVVLEFSHNIIDEAMTEYSRICDNGKSADFEDLLQVVCAKKNGCLMFISEDNGIREIGIFDKVLNSEEFLAYT